MYYKFMAKLKIQNSIIKISWYVLTGLWFLFSLLSASIDPDETILDRTGLFFLVFFIPAILLFAALKIAESALSIFQGKPTELKNFEDIKPYQAAKPTERNWEVNWHGGTAFITFKKQPILLNMILGGLFGGIFTGTFAFAFTESIVVVAVIVTCAACLGAIFGRMTAKHVNSNPDQYKPLLEKTKWGYIQRDALSARIWSKKPATSKPHVSQSPAGVTQQNRGAKTSKIEGKTDA